jgi:hypothetical protein
MNTLLLLLVMTTHAPAGGPGVVQLAPPPTWCDRLRWCYRRTALITSGVAHTYDRPGIPVSNGPTPAYSRYFQQPYCPIRTDPALNPGLDGASANGDGRSPEALGLPSASNAGRRPAAGGKEGELRTPRNSSGK